MNVGRAITEEMEAQRDRDLLRLLLDEMVASGRRIAARLDAAAAQDPEKWGDIAAYHHESLRQVGVEP